MKVEEERGIGNEKGGAASVQPEYRVNRRDVLRWGGWSCVWFFIAGCVFSIARFFFPRMLFEPPTKFKIGFPFEYTTGISERYKQEHRIWVVREVDKLYVIQAKCTHLGCTPNWLAAEGKFKCPCHGSGYTPDGMNVEGPAPRPLERFKVGVAEDGQILVDKGIRFRGERGEWEKLGSYLKV